MLHDNHNLGVSNRLGPYLLGPNVFEHEGQKVVIMWQADKKEEQNVSQCLCRSTSQN